MDLLLKLHFVSSNCKFDKLNLLPNLTLKGSYMKYMVRIFGVLLIIIVIQCSKKEEKVEVKPTLPVLTTSNVTEITRTTASSGGNVTSDGRANITARGICWGINPNPTISGSKSTNGTGIGSFTSTLTELQPNITYFVRAYATNSMGTAYGNEISFTTNQYSDVIIEAEVMAVSPYQVALSGKIIDDGGWDLYGFGFCYSTTTNPTIADSIEWVAYSMGSNEIYGNLYGLIPCTTYYVRAFTSSTVPIVYGNELSFTTPMSFQISTSDIYSMSSTTAISGGDVLAEGACSVFTRGICWSMNANPTLYDSHTDDGAGSGTFISNISGLDANTTFFVRAYSIIEDDTVYGMQQSFTTINVDSQIFGKWNIAIGTYEGINISNLAGYIIIEDGSYKASFNDGSNTGSAEAKYYIDNETIKSNLTGETIALNAGSSKILCCPEVQLWATFINCSGSIFNQWGGTAIGVNDPTYGIENNQLVLRSSDGKTILKYNKE
jgi:hypothetical protein